MDISKNQWRSTGGLSDSLFPPVDMYLISEKINLEKISRLKIKVWWIQLIYFRNFVVTLDSKISNKCEKY